MRKPSENNRKYFLTADEKKKAKAVSLWIYIEHIAIKIAKRTNHKERC